MIVSELIAYTRDVMLRDAALPPLYSDDSLFALIQDALIQFARATLYFRETDNIALQANKQDYQLPQRVIQVLSVWNTVSNAYMLRYRRDYHFDRRVVGTPIGYSVDPARRLLLVFPIPEAASTITVYSAKYPTLTSTNDEIPLRHDYTLLLPNWVVYKALVNNGVDSTNPNLAAVFKAMWEEGIKQYRYEDSKWDVLDYPRAHAIRRDFDTMNPRGGGG